MKLFIWLVCTFLQCSNSVQDEAAGTFKREESKLISTESTQVAALGRAADLGDLYDARTDTFLDISVYTTDLPNDAVHVTESEYSSINYVCTEALSEKMERLGVSSSLSVSFLAGKVRVSGSGKYLNRDKKRSNSAKTSLIYSTRTVNENLKIFSKISRVLMDRFLIENMDATHVVVGIEWGTDVILSLEETNTDSSSVPDVQKKLEDTLKMVAHSLSDKVDFRSFDVEESSTFSLHLHGDIIPNKVPQTISESIDFIRTIPELIEKENDGKGKMMSYVLMPLITVQKVLQSENGEQSFPSKTVNDLDREVINQFVRIFQEMKDSELKINDLYNDMTKWALMISESDFGNVSIIKKEFDSFTNEFRAIFGNLVVRFRNGESDDEALKKLITTYESSDWTPEKVVKRLEIYTPTMHKMKLMNLFQSFNALFLNREMDKYKILASNYQKEVRIISVDLRMDISSNYVSEIIELLEAEVVRYYIEDDPNSTVPEVNAYFEGKVIKKTEYVLLIARTGNVTIIDANSYDQITNYYEPKLNYVSVALVDDALYYIDSKTGYIGSTNIKDIFTLPEDGISWSHVGTFPAESLPSESVAAVNGSDVYFVTIKAVLYKYNIVLKTITKCASIPNSNGVNSLLMVNGILYIYGSHSFHSFDGVSVTTITSPVDKNYANLYDFNGRVCCVGGDFYNVDLYPVNCYEPEEGTWTVDSYINEGRVFPGVVTAQSGTIVVGGWHVSSNGTYVDGINSIEIFNHDTKIWSYIPTPPAMVPMYYKAISFYF